MERILIGQLEQFAIRAATATAVAVAPQIQNSPDINPQTHTRNVSTMGIESMPKLTVSEPSRAIQSNEFVTIKEDKRWFDLINEWREERKNNGLYFPYEEASEIWAKANNLDKAPSILLMGRKLITPQGENLYSQDEKLPLKGIVIPKIEVSASIQSIAYNPETNMWKDPGHDLAWTQFEGRPYPYAILGHRGDIFSDIDQLEVGDKVYFSKGWDRSITEVESTVVRKEIVSKDKQKWVVEHATKDLMLLMACDPKDDPEAPQRLIIWLEPQKLDVK